MKQRPAPHCRHRVTAEIISHAVWLYCVFSLSFRDVGLSLVERGVPESYETVRRWCKKFGQTVEFHRELIQPQAKFPLRIDPCFDLAPTVLSGEHRSDLHGVIERDPPLGVSRPAIDEGDFATNEAFAEHNTQISALGCPGARVQGSRSSHQTRCVVDTLSAWLRLEGSRPHPLATGAASRTLEQRRNVLLSLLLRQPPAKPASLAAAVAAYTA
jgi:hypothetical protein